MYEGSISSNSGASNGKVINLTNSAGKGINWRVYAPAAGRHQVAYKLQSKVPGMYTVVITGGKVTSQVLKLIVQ